MELIRDDELVEIHWSAVMGVEPLLDQEDLFELYIDQDTPDGGIHASILVTKESLWTLIKHLEQIALG